jgi:signal peptidase I
VRESGVIRQCFEALVYLALAVILFRAFIAEGYMISTGSMAPCLLGYHRQVICPTCAFPFSRGTRFHDDDSILAEPDWSKSVVDLGVAPSAPGTVCPNCGLSTIDVRAVPRNEGDQLLVQKHLYQLRPPRRWEVVVFRHPQDPDQAYVKRVVGLPGESIRLIDGDLYADGQLQRKSLSVQQGMRITVYDHDHEPTDDEWRPRWRADADQTQWQSVENRFVHRANGSNEPHWLTYHHWIREGGSHRTSVPLSGWPTIRQDRAVQDRNLTYSTERQVLQYAGVLPAWRANRLRSVSSDPRWTAAIDQLEAFSHESPIVDLYGYNHPESGDAAHPIHDLMLEMTISRIERDGELRVRMTDGWHWFETVLDFARKEVRLHVDEDRNPIRSAPLSMGAFDRFSSA